MPEYKNFETYVTEDHHSNIKESFKTLGELIEESQGPALRQVLDVGCATGALVEYIAELNPSWDFTGLDISDQLLSKARGKMPKYKWHQGSALSLPDQFSDYFDLTLCVGVLGIFDADDAMKALHELVRCTKKGGVIYVFAQFNEFDADVQVTHRKYMNDVCGDWEKGWNIYCMRTIRAWLSNEVESIRFIDFEMPFDLEGKSDPVRTWTLQEGSGIRRLTNGLKLLVDLRFMEIIV